MEDQGKDIALPSTLIVGEDGKVVWIYIGDEPRDRPLVDTVLEVLDGM